MIVEYWIVSGTATSVPRGMVAYLTYIIRPHMRLVLLSKFGITVNIFGQPNLDGPETLGFKERIAHQYFCP